MNAAMPAVEVRVVTDHDGGAATAVLIETRRYPVPVGVVAAEQEGTSPWIIWTASPRGRDLTAEDARAFAAALLEAAAFVDDANTLRSGS